MSVPNPPTGTETDYRQQLLGLSRQEIITHAEYNGDFAAALVSEVGTRSAQLASLTPTSDPVEQAFRAGMTCVLSWMGDAISQQTSGDKPTTEPSGAMAYVDTDSGTVINGPIYAIDPELLKEGLTDAEVIELAHARGEPATPISGLRIRQDRAMKLFAQWNNLPGHLSSDRYVTAEEFLHAIEDYPGGNDEEIFDLVQQRARALLAEDQTTD